MMWMHHDADVSLTSKKEKYSQKILHFLTKVILYYANHIVNSLLFPFDNLKIHIF